MWKAFLAQLSSGRTFGEEEWRRRLPPILLWWHLPALVVVGLLAGQGVLGLLLAIGVPACCAVLARLLRHRHQRATAVTVTFGLVYCSAALVALTHGTIEAHFHFFILIGFIALYEDWLPLLCLVLFTTVSHVVGSYWQEGLIFNHAAGQANPWLWSLTHAIAVLLACVGVVLLRHVTEEVQEKGLLAVEMADAEIDRQKFTHDLLINLARRNQGMLHRQLEIINKLEVTERNPEILNELFTLDHLTTRVRRNAESLLVLSGEQQSRSMGKPQPLREVLRAAIAETEDLSRVVFVADDQLAVRGHIVTDLTHLIAELIENAVRFSPPDSTVAIRARTDWEHPGGRRLIVEDSGIGMSPEQLTEANELLAHPSEVDLSVAQRLGFHVIARLAARHGITVSLRNSADTGTTATVTLPATLFIDSGPGRHEIPATDAPAESELVAVESRFKPAAAPLPRRVPTTVGGAPPFADWPPIEQRNAEPDPEWDDWWTADQVPPADLPADGVGTESGETPRIPSPRPRATEDPIAAAALPPSPALPLSRADDDPLQTMAIRRVEEDPHPTVVLSVVDVEPVPIEDSVDGLARRVPQASLPPELRRSEQHAAAGATLFESAE